MWGTAAGPFLQFINFVYVSSYTLAPLLVRPFLSEKCPQYGNLEIKAGQNCTNIGCQRNNFTVPLSQSNFSLDVSEPCIKHDSEVYGAYTIVAVYCFAAALLFLFILFYDKNERQFFKPVEQHEVEGNLRHPFSKHQLWLIYFLFFLFNFFYGGVEVGYSALVTKFGVQHLGWQKRTAAILVTVVQGTNAVFTALGVLLAKMFKPQMLVLIDMAAVCITLVLLCGTVNSFPVMLWVCSALLGMSYATIMPAMYTWANDEFALTGTFNGAFWCGFFASFGIVAIAGSLIHYLGDMWFCYTMFFCSVVMTVLYSAVKWSLKKPQRTTVDTNSTLVVQ